MCAKHIRVCRCDVACFFAHHDGKSVALFADAFCSSVTKSELLGDVEVVADGQDARSCRNPSVCDNHRSVVKRAVLEEDILDESLCYLGIDFFSCSHELAKGKVVLQDDEGSDSLLAHVHASHHDGEDCLALVTELACVLVLVESEEAEEAVCLVLGSDVVEAAADVFLEKNDDGKGTNAYKLVEDAAKKFHLEHLADDNPSADEEQDTIEDVDGARLLHQFVAIEKCNCHKEDVDYVFETNVRQDL